MADFIAGTSIAEIAFDVWYINKFLRTGPIFEIVTLEDGSTYQVELTKPITDEEREILPLYIRNLKETHDL